MYTCILQVRTIHMYVRMYLSMYMYVHTYAPTFSLTYVHTVKCVGLPATVPSHLQSSHYAVVSSTRCTVSR